MDSNKFSSGPHQLDGGFGDEIVPSEQLRRYTSISFSRIREREKQRRLVEQDLLDQQRQEFLESVFSETEIRQLERRILNSARMGEYKIDAFIFPARYCLDGGRAINNVERGWPETLCGKALSFFEFWNKNAKPRGYKLSAHIIDFPEGFLGNVCLSLDWS